MPELRDYQKKLLNQAEAALQAHQARVMLQLPTGGGKTLIASKLLARWMEKGGKAAWLTHRKELAEQTCGDLEKSGVPAVNRPAWDQDDPAPARYGGVVILMAQTVSRRNHFDGVWEEYGPGDLLIIDEAHHSAADGWERAINQWPGRVVGLTATPWRLEIDRGFNHLFHCLVSGPQISDMQARGWLANAQVLMPVKDQLVIGRRFRSETGDYSRSVIESDNEGRDIWTAGALRYWQTRAGGRQTIVYAVSKVHAENLAVVFKNANVPADVILGDTPPDQRSERIRMFRDASLTVLINVAVATEGFDLPAASCVVLTRPTLSLALYLQMVGRGLRPKSGGGNCLILDLAGNVESHGLPDEERQWSLEPRGWQGECGDAPVVRCPECDAVSPAASHNCRSCGDSFGKDCQRCGKWRSWKRWSAETYCGNDHEQVCNSCHFDAHTEASLFIRGELREALSEELAEMQPEINPTDLYTLEEVQSQMREIAGILAYTHNKATFNGLTRQLDGLLKREAQLRRQFRAELKTKMDANQLRDLEGYVGKISDLDNFGTKNGQRFFEKNGRRIWLVHWDQDGFVFSEY